jgi:hypothetical protein
MVVPDLQQRLWQGVRRAWRSVARAGITAGLAGFASGEVFGFLFNGGHVTFFMHLMALLFGLALAYGAVVTVGIFQAVRGLFTAIGEVETQVRSSMGEGYDHVVDADPRRTTS